MKKRYILFNSLILVSALIIFLIISVLFVNQTNTRNMQDEIINYLHIIEREYNGTNMKDISDTIHSANPKLRITFISLEGKVLYDTSKISEENHLSRPEIKDLGKVIRRQSETTEESMLYVASFLPENSVYIRISMPESSISHMSYMLTWIGIASIVIISILSFIVIYFITSKSVEPLKKEISKLSKIVGETPSYLGNDIDQLSFQITKVGDLIEEKIEAVEVEKRKVSYIIENIDQGLIIIDGKGKIILMNPAAEKIFMKSQKDYINKNYFYVFLNKTISDTIEKSRIEKLSKSMNYTSNGKEYMIHISSLSSSFVKYKEFYGVSLFIYDITESKKLETMKADFFANASHELKSPLTSIIGYQQMIKEGIIVDPEDINDATNKTIKEANRMNQILTEMLELSRLEQQKLEEKKTFSLAKIIDDILISFKVLLEAKNITVTKKYSDFEVNITNSDLYYLLRNLIDNSIKYNKENGAIYLEVDSVHRTFKIQDTGIGIAKEHFDRIFERFYRVDKAKSKESGGTGLGLAIVKHICMNNGLKITIDSVLGEGSIFLVKF